MKLLTFPIEVHVFKHQECYYAFDVRSFSILKLNALGAAVLPRMRNLPLEAIIEGLAPKIPVQSVRAHYFRFLELIQGGVLSVEPVPRPKRPPFNRLILMLAGGCNLGCTYCFEKDVPICHKPNLMTRETADEVLDWFLRHQAGKEAHLQLYGGEPLLNWPVLQHVVERMEAAAQANSVDLSIYLVTNGTLLNPERIAYLKSHNVDIQVSVDGDSETHNRFRVFKSGKPTLDQIKANIGELSRQGAKFSLKAVITRQNKDPKVVINELSSLGTERVLFDVVATGNSQARLTYEDWELLNRKYHDLVYSPYDTWAKLPGDMQVTIKRICERRRVFWCGAGVNEVTVAPDGSIYECERLYRDPYSKISDDKSPNELESPLLRTVDDRPICRDCWTRYLCGGGCWHFFHVIQGKDDPLPEYCVMKRNLVEASIVKIGEIRSLNKVASGRPNGRLEGKCTTEL